MPLGMTFIYMTHMMCFIWFQNQYTSCVPPIPQGNFHGETFSQVKKKRRENVKQFQILTEMGVVGRDEQWVNPE